MTKEERWKHIEILSDLRAKYSCFDDSERPYYEALSAGIKALKQEPCVTDLSEEELKHFAEEMRRIRPQVVEQKPKTGHWINLKDTYGDIVESVCSNCDHNGNYKWKYCPNCGAKMEDEE